MIHFWSWSLHSSQNLSAVSLVFYVRFSDDKVYSLEEKLITIRPVQSVACQHTSIYNTTNDKLGPIPETICSRSTQIQSCDPDRPIAFHKRRSRSAHQIEKIRNQTVYCQLNHDINHSLGNLELKLHDCDWMKNVRLMKSIHDVTMGGVATSFMSADTRASWPVQCKHTVFAHDTTRLGHAIFDR